MTDEAIVDLYWQRQEDAIVQSNRKYGKRCTSTAFNILQNPEDAEECVNDTYMNAWNLMPDQRPKFLGAFLVRITRNLALDKFRKNKAQKRWNGEADIVLEELEYCVSGSDNTSDIIDEEFFFSVINSFLAELNEDNSFTYTPNDYYVLDSDSNEYTFGSLKENTDNESGKMDFNTAHAQYFGITKRSTIIDLFDSNGTLCGRVNGLYKLPSGGELDETFFNLTMESENKVMGGKIDIITTQKGANSNGISYVVFKSEDFNYYFFDVGDGYALNVECPNGVLEEFIESISK